MNRVLYFYFILFAILSFLTQETYSLAVRDTAANIAATKGGVLVKNGKQTYCELGVIDNTAAFVAAPCLDYTGSSVDYKTKYEVYLDEGIDGKSEKYTVSSITVHPDYNDTLNINPIAILEFNQGGSVTWSNSIAINRNQSWDSALFISRGLLQMDPMEWRTPLTVANTNISEIACKNNTYVYEDNLNDLFCSIATTYPPYTYLTNCAIPYGSVDVYISGKLYVAGIYAYTALVTPTYKCMMRLFQYSVYILFSDYVAFASKVLGRSISYYPYGNGVSPQSDSGYAMKAPDSYALALTENGDFYANQTDPLSSNTSSSTSESGEGNLKTLVYPDANSQSGDITSTSQLDSFTDIGDILSDGQNAAANKTAIIGVVCGILGGMLLTAISWYLVKIWKKAHNNIYKDKDARINMQEMLVVDPGYVTVPPSIYIPRASLFLPSAQKSAALKSAPSSQTPGRIQYRENFWDSDDCMSPTNENDSPLPLQLDKSHRHF